MVCEDLVNCLLPLVFDILVLIMHLKGAPRLPFARHVCCCCCAHSNIQPLNSEKAHFTVCWELAVILTVTFSSGCSYSQGSACGFAQSGSFFPSYSPQPRRIHCCVSIPLAPRFPARRLKRDKMLSLASSAIFAL